MIHLRAGMRGCLSSIPVRATVAGGAAAPLAVAASTVPAALPGLRSRTPGTTVAPQQILLSSRAAARLLRRRAEAVRQTAISRQRIGSFDPELVEDLSSRVVEALLAPVLAGLDTAHGSHRHRELAEAVVELFDLCETVGRDSDMAYPANSEER